MTRTDSTQNPFQQLISECDNDPVRCFHLPIGATTGRDDDDDDDEEEKEQEEEANLVRINLAQTKMQRRYETHRAARNAQYKNTILCRHFPGWSVDEILRKIQQNGKRRQEDDNEELFVDTRKNLAFYARPPQHIRELIGEIQEEVRKIAPSESPFSKPSEQAKRVNYRGSK